MNIATDKPAQRVDLNILTEVETGDIIQIHFKAEAFDGVISLLGMISRGIVVSPDYTTLLAIASDNSWGGDANRYIKLVVASTFDWNWFSNRLQDRIDKLEILSRTRPLVDTRELSQTEAVFSFRFKSGVFDGIAELLELNELGTITLDDVEKFQKVLKVSDWEGHGRAGEFTNHLLSQNTMEYHDYFMTRVAPHLEMLRN